jgi:phosphoribosylaminoimidazole-succinocarboxamide synthase
MIHSLCGKPMTLTPEQFNKLVTKADLRQLEDKFDTMTGHMSGLVTAVDSIVKDMVIIKQELVANQVAHGRFDRRIGRTEKALKLKPMNA